MTADISLEKPSTEGNYPPCLTEGTCIYKSGCGAIISPPGLMRCQKGELINDIAPKRLHAKTAPTSQSTVE